MATYYYRLLLSCIICFCSADSLVDNYQLRYWREGNELLLFCDTPAPFDDTVSFRINNSFIPIISQGFSMHTFRGLNTTQPGQFVQRREHMQVIKFNLQPDNEGTVYCGNPINNTWSRGEGPFVADPSTIEFYQQYLHQEIRTSNGSNETLICPVQIGKLAQFYTVEWLGITEKSNRFKIEFKNFSFKNNSRILTLSTVTIRNIQDIDYKLYSCQVKVTNPRNNDQWEIKASIDVAKRWTWNWSPPTDIYDSFFKEIAHARLLLLISFVGIMVSLSTFILRFFLKHFCCNNFRRTKRFNEETKPLLTVAEEGENFGECYHEEEVNVIKDGSNLQLEKDCIGIGAFGTVFRGTYKGFVCAAKMLTHHAQFYASERNYELEVQELALQSLQKECEYLKELSHDNIVRYIDTINDCKSNLPILVMELMDCNLKTYLTRKSQSGLLPSSYQFHLFFDISQGLKFLHSKSYIHRDMCDDNVLLKEDGNLPTAKISDFGMSRIIPQDQMTLTLTALGHRQVYLPPEASEYPINYTHTLDVYALGVLGLQIALSEVQVKSCTTLLDKLPEEHSLRKTIAACLQEDRLKRPSSSDVVNMITVL